MERILYDQTLYKQHSTGQIGSWRIIVEVNDDDTATMCRIAKKTLDSKPVETHTEYTKGKNIGRANETTAPEQCLAEAQARYKKQLDKGYVQTEQEAQAPVTNSLGFRKPMLAQPIEKVKDWGYPVYANAKLDGHRLLATVRDGTVVLYSRQGKEVDVAHVQQLLQGLYSSGKWSGTTLDGEIYQHGETLQRISSLVKKPKAGSERLVYYVYDIMHEAPYTVRRDILCGLLCNLGDHRVIHHDAVLVAHQDRLDELHAEYIGQGYEGTIVRQGNEPYQDGKRAKQLMKMKDFVDEEFLVIGMEFGKPTIRGEMTYQVPILVCQTERNKVFNVTAPGDMHEKHRLATDVGLNVIGEKLTVKYFNLTPDGIPFHPVALRFREDI